MVRTSQKGISNHSPISSTPMKIKNILKSVLLIGGLAFVTASCTNKNDEPVIEQTNQYIHKGVVVGKTTITSNDNPPIYIILFFDGQHVYRIVVSYDKYSKLKDGMKITADIREDINYEDEELSFD